MTIDKRKKLEARLESEEAHYTRLVEQLAEERAKNERLEGAARELLQHACLEEGDYLWTLDYELARRDLKALLEGE